MLVTAPEGTHSFAITIAVDGETLRGTAGKDEIFTGTIEDGAFQLSGEHYVDEAGSSGMLEMSGIFDGEGIAGDASWEGFVGYLEGTRRGGPARRSR